MSDIFFNHSLFWGTWSLLNLKLTNSPESSLPLPPQCWGYSVCIVCVQMCVITPDTLHG